MRLVRHPLALRDSVEIATHVFATTGDLSAALRRQDEIDALLDAILDNPDSGVRLSGPLLGWLVRHGGRGQRITIVFRPDFDHGLVLVLLVSFGGQNWIKRAAARHSTFPKTF